MKKIILIMLSLVLIGSMVGAQTVSVTNTTDTEIGEFSYGENAETGVIHLRNATGVSVSGDWYDIEANVRFKLGFADDANIDLDSISIDDDTKIAAYVRPFAGFEIGAGTHLEDSIGVDSIWWDTDATFNQVGNSTEDKYYGYGTRYANAGFMIRYTGIEGLMLAAVLPTDSDYASLFEGEDIIPMNFAASYTMADKFSVGGVAKINVLSEGANQFTGSVNYLGSEDGEVGAYYTYTTESDAKNDSFSQFGIVGNVNVAGFTIAPEFSMQVAEAPVGVDTNGIPLFAKADISYPMGNMTPAVTAWYSSGSYVEGTDNETTRFAVEPSVEYTFGDIGTASVGVNFRVQEAAWDDGLDLKWYIPISWSVSL